MNRILDLEGKIWQEATIWEEEKAAILVYRLEGTKVGHAPKSHLRPITIYKNFEQKLYVFQVNNKGNGIFLRWLLRGKRSGRSRRMWAQSGCHIFYPLTFKADSTVLPQVGVSTSHCSPSSHVLGRGDSLLSHVQWSSTVLDTQYLLKKVFFFSSFF